MEHQHKQDQKNFKKQKHYCNKLNKGFKTMIHNNNNNKTLKKIITIILSRNSKPKWPKGMSEPSSKEKAK